MAKKRERLAAIVIGLIMIGSIVGFAISSVTFQPEEETTIPTIVDRPLSSQEISFLLGNGITVIRNKHPEFCEECVETDNILVTFVTNFQGFVVLENTLVNETKVEIIGKNGQIKEIEDMTQESLLGVFCEVAMLVPRECLLSEI